MAELGPGRGVRDTPVCGLCTRNVASDSKQTIARSTHVGGHDAAPQMGLTMGDRVRPKVVQQAQPGPTPGTKIPGPPSRRMKEPQASLPFMVTLAPSPPVSAPGTDGGRSRPSSQPPPSSPPFTPSDSEFRADKQKQAQNAPDSRLRATSCTQLLPRPRPSAAISGRAPRPRPRPRPHHTLEVGERKNREVWRSKPQSHRAAPGEETAPGRRPWTSQCCRREVRLYQDTQLLRPCKCHHSRCRAEPTSGL